MNLNNDTGTSKMTAEIEKAFKMLTRYHNALQEIAHNEHAIYERNENSSYGKGVTDGHRYCAVIAKQALWPIKEGGAG